MAASHFISAKKIYSYNNDDIKYVNKTINLQAYIKSKIKMLEEDFKIRLTYAEKEHLEKLTNDRAIDIAVRQIIKNHL